MAIGRCVIHVDGVPRVLFHVSQTAKGDLMISTTSASYTRHNDDGDATPNVPIREDRYSIHTSPNSKTGNLIKQTLKDRDGKISHIRHFTEAMKTRDRLAPLYVARTVSLRHDRYISNDSPRTIVDLGAYNPSELTLYYTVFVAREGHVFDSGVLVPHATSFEQDFSPFRLIVMSSFAAMPSDQIEMTMTVATFHPDKLTPEQLATQSKNMEGESDENARHFLTSIRRRIFEHCCVMPEVNGQPDFQKHSDLTRRIGFFGDTRPGLMLDKRLELGVNMGAITEEEAQELRRRILSK